MFLLFPGLIVVFVLLMDARSKISRMEMRLRQLERPGEGARVAPARVVVRTVEPSQEVPPDLAPEPVATPAPKRRAAIVVNAPPREIIAPVVEEIAAARSTPAAPVAPPPVFRPKRNWTFNFEDLFGRRLPIWAGGITLAIAGVLIAKYAIDAGLMKIFTPWVRVIGGLLFGSGLIAGAELARRNEIRVDDVRIRQALSGAGIATLYATILVASNVYTLITPLAAFTAFAIVTASALALSIRFGAPSAVLGLAGGLAAPAMVGGMQPNVPLLAVYLALTIAGLAGVSRMQRWAWLGIIAIAGGAGWSLWMIAASSAFDTMATLSVGGYVLLLAVALPMLVIEGPRAALFRMAAAIIGAAQLALMVALGGFSLLNWGLFALLAAAGQWLAWRDKGLAIVPTISLALSALLLVIWPEPAVRDYLGIGGALALIHGLPLLASLWKSPAVLQRAIELCALAAAALIVTMVQYYQPDRDALFAWIALGAALIPVIGIVTGWSREDRQSDARFAILTATSATLFAGALCFAAPDWQWPIGLAAIAAVLLFFGERARDVRIDAIAASFAAATLPMLISTGPGAYGEWMRLGGETINPVDGQSVLRWSALAALGTLFAMRSRTAAFRLVAQAVAAFIAYGAIAQFAPATLLPLVAPIALVALALASARSSWPRLAPAFGAAAAIGVAWAVVPIAVWGGSAQMSLLGIPMEIDAGQLTPGIVVRQLLALAAALAFAVWHGRAQFPAIVRTLAGFVAGGLALIGVHTLYRIGFAQSIGSDFVQFGMAQRLVWEALLIGAGWLAARSPALPGRGRIAPALVAAGTLHAAGYSLILHNPLWAEQAVGSLPLINLLVPAFGMVFGGATLLGSLLPEYRAKAERGFQLLVMALVSGFAWATLRQAFHGTLLVQPGVFDAEDILRSILAIALAVGFLLWGIRTQRRDWRIASLVLMLGAVGKVFLFDASGLEGLMRIGSFVALGFSLIGIGWLYSRQLGRDAAADASAPAVA